MKANAFIVLLVVILIALMIVAEPAVMAHHSFAAAFDLNKSITVKGTITRVEWANPHISIYLDVKDKAGTVTKWGVDGAAPSALVNRGLDRNSLKPGETITVEGYPARDGKPFAAASTVTLPDGRRILAGNDGAVPK
jgi:DNA/RNA endonuclease YhcR with UshA esterase domain